LFYLCVHGQMLRCSCLLSWFVLDRSGVRNSVRKQAVLTLIHVRQIWVALKIGRDHFLSCPSQYSVHSHPFIQLSNPYSRRCVV
jgi:hypothetical protein